MQIVTVYYTRGQRRSMLMAESLYKGVRKAGYRARCIDGARFRNVDSDLACFYGLSGNLKSIFRAYRDHPSAHAMYADLGYYHRRYMGRYRGYYKLSVDNRHPSDYFSTHDMPSDRWDQLVVLGGLRLEDWREPGDDILVAGMSAKASAAEGLGPSQWERAAINEIRRNTERKIRFRPKPNCLRTRPIPGTVWYKDPSLDASLDNVYAVVARHSNVCVDALLRGIPIFCDAGIAREMGLSDISQIETPYYPDNREQFLHNMAYQQWNADEIESGLPFGYLREIGVLP